MARLHPLIAFWAWPHVPASFIRGMEAGPMRSNDRPAEMLPSSDAPTAETADESFDWAEYEAWEARPSQDALLWMLEEDG